MRVLYPTVREMTGLELAKEFVTSGWRPLVEAEVTWAGSGSPLDLQPIEAAAVEVDSLLHEFRSDEPNDDRDLLEGGVTESIHSALRDVAVLALDDPAFWQYLSLAHFWDFVYWREEPAFSSGDPAKYLRYVDGTKAPECVLRRTFLRGQALGGDDGYALAPIEKASDFWRSHVIRVSLGSSVHLTRALAREHRDNRLPWTELRQVATRLNRQVTNVVLPMVGSDEAASMVRRAREGG